MKGVVLMRVETISLRRIFGKRVLGYLFLMLAASMVCMAVLQSCAPSQRESSIEANPVSEEPVFSDGVSAVNAAGLNVDYPVNDYGETYGGLDDVPEGAWGSYEDFVGMYPRRGHERSRRLREEGRFFRVAPGESRGYRLGADG